MTAGIKKAATDLDSIFDPYVSGTKPALTNLKAGAQDLRDRYAPISVGTAAAATGIKIATGADLNTLFAAFGTASYAGPKLPGFAPSYTNDRGGIHDIAANVTLTIKSDGTWAVTKTVAGTIEGAPLSGTWHTNPAASVGASARMRWTDAGPWMSLSGDHAEEVSAFATTGEGGPTFDSQNKSFQITIEKTDGTQSFRQATSITATASV